LTAASRFFKLADIPGVATAVHPLPLAQLLQRSTSEIGFAAPFLSSGMPAHEAHRRRVDR
jgi:hypothetical protein